MVVIFVLLSALFGTGMSSVCAPGFNANIMAGCSRYFRCANGVATFFDCADLGSGFVYNAATEKCEDPIHVQPPCGVQKNCTNKEDKSYADLDNRCVSYYTCKGGNLFGHHTCSQLFVFDEAIQNCNFPGRVRPPCGSKRT